VIGERDEMGGWLEDGKGGSNSNTISHKLHLSLLFMIPLDKKK